MNAQDIITFLTPVIVPIVLLGVKKAMPHLGSWVIPLLAPLLGVGLDFVNTLATSHQSNILLAATLGLAGVGLREAKEAVRPSVNGGWPVP